MSTPVSNSASHYLNLLPAVLHRQDRADGPTNEFLSQFLVSFERILNGIEGETEDGIGQVIERVASFFDPAPAPWTISNGLEVGEPVSSGTVPPKSWKIPVQTGVAINSQRQSFFMKENATFTVVRSKIKGHTYLVLSQDNATQAILNLLTTDEPIGVHPEISRNGKSAMLESIPLAKLSIVDEQLHVDRNVLRHVARTPEEFLPWLARWAALSLRDDWSTEEKRRFISRMAGLYRKRGTPAGLRELLHLYTGLPIYIVDGHRPDFDYRPHTFKFVLQIPEGTNRDLRSRLNAKRRISEKIVAREKPAHTDPQIASISSRPPRMFPDD